MNFRNWSALKFVPLSESSVVCIPNLAKCALSFLMVVVALVFSSLSISQ